MVIDDLNYRGGLLGRPVEVFVEDSTTDDSVAEAATARLVERAVDVVCDIYSSMRQAIRRPVVDGAETPDIHLEQYEGQGCHPPDLLHRAGAGAAGQALLPLADGSRPGRSASTCPRPTRSGRKQ
jgi:ABC-type branched-subunit amino acid transport system substrate-binding protein